MERSRSARLAHLPYHSKSPPLPAPPPKPVRGKDHLLGLPHLKTKVHPLHPSEVHPPQDGCVASSLHPIPKRSLINPQGISPLSHRYPPRSLPLSQSSYLPKSTSAPHLPTPRKAHAFPQHQLLYPIDLLILLRSTRARLEHNGLQRSVRPNWIVRLRSGLERNHGINRLLGGRILVIQSRPVQWKLRQVHSKRSSCWVKGMSARFTWLERKRRKSFSP